MQKNWIQKAGLKKGALHEELGVPTEKKISEPKLEAASHSDDSLLRKRAALAKTFRSF